MYYYVIFGVQTSSHHSSLNMVTHNAMGMSDVVHEVIEHPEEELGLFSEEVLDSYDHC